MCCSLEAENTVLPDERVVPKHFNFNDKGIKFELLSYPGEIQKEKD